MARIMEVNTSSDPIKAEVPIKAEFIVDSYFETTYNIFNDLFCFILMKKNILSNFN